MVTAAPVESVTVVLNPTKIGDRDRFRAEVARVVETRSGTTGVPIEVAWTQTTVDDPGAGQTRRAVEQGASLVIAVGGDGTVTACAGVLAGTGVALGVVPVGTGNLLARNLGIPLQRESALATAFDDHVRSIDVLASGERRFVVMAGMGLDAVMIRSTDNDLKATLGWLGYLEGVRRAIVGAKGARYTVIVDDSDTAIRQKAVGVVVANVGKLVGGLTLTSTAVPDDGRFDVVILAPHGRILHWLTMVAHVVLRRLPEDRNVHVTQAHNVKIHSDRPMPVEYDGEYAGQTDELSITVLRESLNLRCPASKQGLIHRFIATSNT